jgi:diguanylate cyclase (GGDEF)-like protein
VDGGACVTVITLDVDGLKATNDAHGHDAGDELLRRCGFVLREFCRDGDTVARLGGDEFALLLPVDRELAQHRLAALAERFNPTPGCPRPLSASVGAGTARPGDRVADAVRDADTAMYAHKRARRANSCTRTAG